MFSLTKKIIIGVAIALIFVTPVTHAQSTPSDDPTIRTTLEAIKSYLETRLGQLKTEIGLTTQPIIVQQVTKKSSRSSRDFNSAQVDSIYENLNENISGTESSILASLPQIIESELTNSNYSGFFSQVGVGTTTSLAKLAVQGGGVGTDKTFEVTDSTGASTFTVLDNGNVGVGISSPTQKLDVEGAALISGVLTANSLDVVDAAATRANLGLTYATDGEIASNTNINIAAWGDSLTAGTGGTSYRDLLAFQAGYSIYNGGVGGETSTEIKDRMLMDTARHNLPTVIWAGRNNNNSPAQVKSDIAEMVGALSHQNYVILSILNRGSGDEDQGSLDYNRITQLNTDLSAIYGSRFLDIRERLVSLYDPNIPQDVTDFNNDVPPSSLRHDSLHLNTEGNKVVANLIHENIDLLISNSGPKVLVNTNLYSIFANAPVIGSERLNNGYFDNLGVGTQTPLAKLQIKGTGTTTQKAFSILDSGDDEKFTVLDNGNVGIGTSTPNTNLEIREVGVGSVLRLTRFGALEANDTVGSLEFYKNDTSTGGEGSPVKISARTTNAGGTFALDFITGSISDPVETMTLLPSGNVGIGTITPLAKLQIKGTGTTTQKAFSILDSGDDEKFTVLDNGNVGIGTSTPGQKLDISGSIKVIGSNNGVKFGTGADTPTILNFDNDDVSTGGASVRFFRNTNTTGTTVLDIFSGNGTDNPQHRLGGKHNSYFSASIGNVGIGTTNPLEKLHVDGTIRASNLTGGATNLTTDANGNIIRDPSDIKLKKNINTLERSLDKVLALRGVSYNWKDTERFGTQTEIGFIAQEVELIVPEVVRSGGEYKSINTRNLIAIAVGGIQELYEIVIGFGERVETDELCVEGVCINGEQLSKILEESGYSDGKISNNDRENQDKSGGSISDQDEKNPKNQEPTNAEDSEVAGEEGKDENSSENIDDGNEESEGIVSQAEGEGLSSESTEEEEGEEHLGGEEETKDTASEEKKEESTPETEEENNDESENEEGTELTP